MSRNRSLRTAARVRNDEFYTQIEDIENEIGYYTNHFKNKTILCNCDDPFESNFFVYLRNNFHEFGLKKIITICYKSQNPDLFSQNDSEKAVSVEYNGFGDKKITYLNGDGDFRSKECIEILKTADIVVTNPPFSLFREYVDQLITYNKQFLIIGSLNAISYNEIFSLIQKNKLWLGCTSPKRFFQQDGTIKQFGNINWYTNLNHEKRNEEILLTEKYNINDYPKYENYDAINVDKVVDIPIDYTEEIGVPISFLSKYNPNQFEIIGAMNSWGFGVGIVNGKNKYFRIVIKNK